VSRLRSIPLLGLLLLGLLASGFLDALPAAIRFLLAFSIVSWIPGAILTGRFLHPTPRGSVEKAVLWLCLGLSSVSLLTWPAKIAGLSFGAYSIAVQWGLVVCFAAALVADFRLRAAGGRRRRSARSPAESSGATLPRGLAAVAAVLALVMLLQPPRFEFQQDSFDHIGYIRHIVSENTLSPAGVLAQPKDAGEAPVKEDSRKGTFQPVVALAARMSAVDPIDAWATMPAVFMPLAFLSFAWFCSVFLPRRRLVWACAALFLLFQGGTGVLEELEFANGQGVWLVFYWILVPLSLRYVSSRSSRDLWATLIVFAGGALMHIGLLAQFGIAAATLLLFHRWLRLDTRAVVRLTVWGAAVGAAVLVWKYATSLGAGNEIHVHRQGVLYLTSHVFVASPVEILRQNGLVFLGGLVLVPFMLFAVRRHLCARFQLSFAVIPFVACFFPPLVPVLYNVAAYMVFRTILDVPAFAVVVTAVYLLAVWSRRWGWASRVAAALVLVVWCEMFLVPGVGAFGRSYEQRRARRDEPPLMERYDDIVRFLRQRPRDSVVLSDPKTSYLLSAATDQRFVAVLAQHGTPNDPYAYDRLAAVRDVLSPWVRHSRTVAACERYGVDFVVVNGRLRNVRPDFLDNWSPTMYEGTCAKLQALEKRFDRLYQSNRVAAYLFRPGSAPTNEWIPEGAPPAVDVADVRDCTVQAPGNVFAITKLGVYPERVIPGETVEVTLGYEMPDWVSYGLPYVVSIRFDHYTVALKGKGYFFDKQVRRFLERRGGYLLRFRIDHRPFGGIYPVDQWPAAGLIYDVFPVKLPAALKPGKYVVEVSIHRESLLPNFQLRDFFYNRDQYSGPECATMDVTRQLVR
jgi:hypothetical protein